MLELYVNETWPKDYEGLVLKTNSMSKKLFIVYGNRKFHKTYHYSLKKNVWFETVPLDEQNKRANLYRKSVVFEDIIIDFQDIFNDAPLTVKKEIIYNYELVTGEDNDL